MRILLVEDDTVLGGAVRDQMIAAGHSMDWVTRLDGAGDALAVTTYDLVLLDLMLPDGRGITFLRALRARGDVTPVIILTALDQVSNRIDGLNAGADDYLPKPFQMEELLARLAAILRRSGGHVSSTIEVGPLRLDLRRQAASIDGRSVDLSSLEFRLLRYLVHHRGRIVGQGELAEHVYESGREPDNNALEALVARLRRKVGADLITTRRGQGYVVEA